MYHDHSPERIKKTRLLALSLLAVAVLQAIPALVSMLGTDTDSEVIHRWVYWMLFLATVEFGFAMYLLLFPDWSSIWVVAMVSLLNAALLAIVVSVRVLGQEQNVIVNYLQLNIKVNSGMQQVLLLLAFVLMSSILSFIAGRTAIRWKRNELEEYQAS